MKTKILAAMACLAMMGTAHAQSFGYGAFDALIQADGTTTFGSGIQASVLTGTGKYRITFTRPVAPSCVFVTSPRGNNGGQTSSNHTGLGPTQLDVSTFNAAGVPTNLSFALIAICSSGSP
jgi:hypothetical protein